MFSVQKFRETKLLLILMVAMVAIIGLICAMDIWANSLENDTSRELTTDKPLAKSFCACCQY